MSQADQQQETLKYFQDFAHDWKEKALGNKSNKVNVIKLRNQYVLQVIQERSETLNFLDVGCGTGDLVHDTARMQIDSLGIDFAENMITLARDNAEKESLHKARFVVGDIFEYGFENQQFDVIAANGFIEYISFAQLREFLKLSQSLLRKGGSLVVGSRNRLFNLHSMNNYTAQEVEQGTILNLLNEALGLAQSDGRDFTAFYSYETAPYQHEGIEHTNTGIDVTQRFQYTPIQLIKLLKEHGFITTEIYPVHIHSLPPSAKAENPEIHTNVADLLQSISRYHLELLPQSSTFMVRASYQG
jgi:2-polyprenyl-3-methyl-5-hydroxy-6-metoxy-1,4-benzoquinol methylase